MTEETVNLHHGVVQTQSFVPQVDSRDRRVLVGETGRES
jgi:hypothetical protein